MNLDNDYDEDGNNIVPCPLCLSAHCPSKDGGKCPEEDAFKRAMNTPDYINKFRERWSKSGFTLDTFEELLAETYEQGRKDERESKEPLGICENCDIDNHSDCLGCKCHADY